MFKMDQYTVEHPVSPDFGNLLRRFEESLYCEIWGDQKKYSIKMKKTQQGAEILAYVQHHYSNSFFKKNFSFDLYGI